MAKKCEIDRLSALPDNILSCNIFSHLPLLDIFRTSVLSRRWRYLWKQISNIDFYEEYFDSVRLSLGNNTMGDIAFAKCMNDIIGDTLLLHSGPIERFTFVLIHSGPIERFSSRTFRQVYRDVFKSLNLGKWIYLVAQKEVKHLHLRIPAVLVDIPQSLFACHLLRDLELDNFRFTGIPTEFGGFRSLQSLCLSRLHGLTDDGLKQLVGLCPFLHKLVLRRCSELINLKIQAPNLHSLTVADCFRIRSLTADCPKLVELEIDNCESLSFTGMPMEFRRFRTLQSCVLANLGSLTDEILIHLIGLCPRLQKLVLGCCSQLINLEIQAPNLHSLTIADCCSIKSLTAECPQLVELHIKNSDGLRFTGIPIEFGGFPCLQSCFLSDLGDLTDDGLIHLIGLCPLLKKLVLAICRRLTNLKIQAPNLNSLTVAYLDHMQSLTADCPQLVELEIENCYEQFEFKVNSCVLFHGRYASDVQIPMLNSLRKLSVKACSNVSDLSLLTTLGRLPNLEEVHIQICEEDQWEQRETGEVVADLTIPCLKKAYVDISSTMKEEEVIMLAFLLNNAPSLNTITVVLPYCPTKIHDKKFINKVRELQQIYEKVDIRMKIDEWRYDPICVKTQEKTMYEYLGNNGSDLFL